MPTSQAPSHLDWEPILLQADYDFVYQDGLNRFYVARGHEELRKHFAFLTNVFDAFNSSEGLVVLGPGQHWSGQWGLVVHR